MTHKPIIYQVFTRLYGNRNTTRKEWGSVEENGTGKFSDFDTKTLKAIKQMGVSHIWYTGVIRHASQTDFSKFGIPTQHPSVVKGKAGSPYAICDYYDVDPDLADNVNDRMKEFEALVSRTHKAGLKMFIDFVPNHVARQYLSIAKPKGVVDLGADDDKNQGFNPQNNFYYCPGQSLDLSSILESAPSLRGRAGGEAVAINFTQDNPIGLGRNGERVAKTPRRSLPPRRGGRTVRPLCSCLLAENPQISHI